MTTATTAGRTRWVIGNWKQNKLRAEAQALAAGVAAGHEAFGAVHVGIAPTFLAVSSVLESTRANDRGPVWLFAQNVAAQDSGAFTGEVGPAMLLDAGANGAIIGHSERRSHFKEDDALLATKLHGALKAGLTAVLCVGEPLAVREAGDHESHVISQLSVALQELPPEHVGERLVIAYEPVWAIGTGKTATPELASAMHRTIRGWLRERFGEAGAGRSILYGGSVKPGNAAGLIAAGDIDGFLVGGASLDASSFLDIVRSAA